ncbi:MAG: 16S rRNA (cytidine(1402)-2'-O)-methyltransferase [Chitinophagales bacterium]|nr:16S rRNA (cytidine(1402)-2'-O)-methyltransferase [Chitinophagaceae bacterium]MCB9064068.1 16S rRNA (cytidine(1402)-2'-O)-methyltransferase [Chitinophagales bacterium]
MADNDTRLYLVPSPIGNLGDITYRAVETLQKADAILCEDTRTSSVLLKHYNIQKPLYPHHQHNEHKAVQGIIDQLLTGKTFALLTDAGTPGISDPGFLLVRECVRNNIKVECLPGASAFIPALVQSGLPSTRFTFEGFPPQKKGRQTFFKRLTDEERTIILYESPHRLVKSLKEMTEYLGSDREAAVCRELTKMFEETRRGTLAELAEHFTATPPKGEIVIVISGKN